jgi:hypothetical protein
MVTYRLRVINSINGPWNKVEYGDYGAGISAYATIKRRTEWLGMVRYSVDVK